jgi:hypothetical protein
MRNIGLSINDRFQLRPEQDTPKQNTPKQNTPKQNTPKQNTQPVG